MSRTKEIALAFPIAEPHLVRMTRGIAEYARKNASWNFLASLETPMLSVASLQGWPGDGIVATINTVAEARAAKKLRIPVVNVSGALAHPGLPRAMVDQVAIGEIAADHLLTKRFAQFAYVGLRGVYYSQQRQKGFVRRIQQSGGSCSVLEISSSIDSRVAWWQDDPSVKLWLSKLRTPVGLLAAHDARGAKVVEICRQIGLRVPEDVAVLGVDNQVTLCELCRVPLSSVDRNDHEAGLQAAALLDRLMAGESPPEHEVLVRPSHVQQRKSTDVLAIEDPQLAAAVRFIDRNATDGITVGTLLRHLPVSRRWLELRFQEHLDCTPHEYICQTRVTQAKGLLVSNSKMKLHQVASACGFTDTRHLRSVFQRVTGQSCGEYRRSALEES